MAGHTIIPSPLQQRYHRHCLIMGSLAILGVALMPYIGEVGMANPKTASTLGLWVNFFGHLHPVFLHLPIGAFMLVIVMELGSIFTKGGYRPNTTLGLFFTSATGLFALFFGYALYLTGDFQSELMEEHKRDGIIFTILIIVTFLVKYSADLRPKQRFYRPLYYITLVASCAALLGAGHHGGEITHGDPLDVLPSKILKNRANRESKQVATVDPVVYTDIIHPILIEKCITCHGAKKKKSGLRMDSYAYLLEGGEEGDCLVPGDLQSSGLISTLHLPLSDDLRMPPEDKPQLTEDEIKVLEWWVKIGAPEHARLSEVEREGEVDGALHSIMGH